MMRSYLFTHKSVSKVFEKIHIIKELFVSQKKSNSCSFLTIHIFYVLLKASCVSFHLQQQSAHQRYENLYFLHIVNSLHIVLLSVTNCSILTALSEGIKITLSLIFRNMTLSVDQFLMTLKIILMQNQWLQAIHFRQCDGLNFGVSSQFSCWNLVTNVIKR